MEVLAIIPARGGSKGVPRKNVRLLAGKPLIAHTIEQALSSSLVNRTIVSTEDAEIADVARQSGAEVVWRPEELAADTSVSEAALLHVLDHLVLHEGYTPDVVVFLQCTSPVRRPGDIDAAVEKLVREQGDSLISVTPWHGFIWRRGKKADTLSILSIGNDPVGSNCQKSSGKTVPFLFSSLRYSGSSKTG